MPSTGRRIFDFFIFSSLFIACCAVLMVWQTTLLFHIDFSLPLAGFVFGGTICSYNLHWYLTPPAHDASGKLAWNLSNKNLHLFLAVTGLTMAAIFAIFLLEHWYWLGLTALATFLYTAPKVPHPLFRALKNIAVGKTIYLAMVWMLITAFLPIVMARTAWDDSATIYCINRFFFIYAICILFDYRDVEQDRRAGIKSLITFFTEKGIDRLFWLSQAIVLVTLLLLMSRLDPVAMVCLLIPAIILSLLYNKAKRDFSDYLYYFILDGLMMLSAPLVVLATFAR